MLNHHWIIDLQLGRIKRFPGPRLGDGKILHTLEHIRNQGEYLGPNLSKQGGGETPSRGPMYKPKTVKNRCVIHYTCTKITKYVIMIIQMYNTLIWGRQLMPFPKVMMIHLPNYLLGKIPYLTSRRNLPSIVNCALVADIFNISKFLSKLNHKLLDIWGQSVSGVSWL